MIRQLRADATRVLCSRVAKARGSPSPEPTKTENSMRESCSDLRMVASMACRSALLRCSPAATCSTSLRGVRVGTGQLVDRASRATDPLVAGAGLRRRDRLREARQIDREGDQHEEE